MKDFLYIGWVAYCTIISVISVLQGENVFGMLLAWAILAFFIPMAIAGDKY